VNSGGDGRRGRWQHAFDLQHSFDFSRVHEGVRQQIEEMQRSAVPSTSLFEVANCQIYAETQARVEEIKRLLETDTLRAGEILRPLEPTASSMDELAGQWSDLSTTSGGQ